MPNGSVLLPRLHVPETAQRKSNPELALGDGQRLGARTIQKPILHIAAVGIAGDAEAGSGSVCSNVQSAVSLIPSEVGAASKSGTTIVELNLGIRSARCATAATTRTKLLIWENLGGKVEP